MLKSQVVKPDASTMVNFSTVDGRTFFEHSGGTDTGSLPIERTKDTEVRGPDMARRREKRWSDLNRVSSWVEP